MSTANDTEGCVQMEWTGDICDSCYLDLNCLWEFYDVKCTTDLHFNDWDYYENNPDFIERFWVGDCTTCWFNNACITASYSEKCKDDPHYYDDEYYNEQTDHPDYKPGWRRLEKGERRMPEL